MKPQEFKPLQTARLDLKPLVATFDFANELFDIISKNKDFFKFIPIIAEVKTAEEEFDFLRSAERGWRNKTSADYGIYLRGTNDFVGICSFFFKEKNYESGEIGYWLNPKHSGHGFMAEALQAISDSFFDMGVKRIQMAINPDNISSWKTAEKCGFEREGIMRSRWNNSILKKREDMALYAKINDK